MNAWLTDRYGADIEDTSEVAVRALLQSVVGIDDPEHGSVSVAYSNGWSLEFYPGGIEFENVEPPLGTRRHMISTVIEDRLTIAMELVDGQFDRLFARDWKPGHGPF